jgi:hypothetical protein
MEESGKEISMREYPLSSQDNRRRQWLTVFTCVCHWNGFVEVSFYEVRPSTIRIGERSNGGL